MFGLVAIMMALSCLSTSHAEVGWNVALTMQKNRLNPYKAMEVLKQLSPKLNYTKTFDLDPDLLRAMQMYGIRNIIVGVTNLDLKRCATTGDLTVPSILQGLRWLYNDGVQLTIAVGNEPNLYGVTQWLYPALVNFRTVLAKMGMNKVKLTTPFSAHIIGNSYPPSKGTLATGTASVVVTVARFLKNDGSPFTVTLYPAWAEYNDPTHVPLPYARLETSLVASDGITYPNMLMAMYASMRSALLSADPTFTEANLPIIVGETGWRATTGNARDAQIFMNNVYYSGVPSVYLFEAFDEALKGGSEGTWGWMNEAGIPKYPINWTRI